MSNQARKTVVWGAFVEFPPKVRIRPGSEYDFIEMDDLTPGIRLANSKTRKRFDGGGASKFDDGDTLFARITPCLDNRKISMANVSGPSFGSTEFFVFRARPGISDKNFVYYLSTTDLLVQSAINSYVGASGRQRADAKFLKKIELEVPCFEVQRKIAAVLTAYDDLIETNRRRVAILDRLAEQIYREWFVRYRFPSHGQAKFEKGVPHGWKSGRFKDLCTLQRGFDLPDFDIVDGDYPVIASTSIKAYHNAYKVEPPVITTGRSGSLGEVLWTSQKAWPLNTSLFVKNFLGNSPYYVFHTLRAMKLENFNSGAGVPTLNRNHLNSLPICLPPHELQEEFSERVAPIRTLMDGLSEASEQLRRTRDLLLPRLISGKLRVDDLDTLFPASMQASCIKGTEG